MKAKLLLSMAAATAIAVTFTACGGDDNTTTQTIGATVISKTAFTGTANGCTNGGITVNIGIDDNKNGELDSSEIDTTEYICHGTNGTNGTDGANGEDGVDTTMIGNPGGFASKLQFTEIATPILEDEKNVSRSTNKATSLVTNKESNISLKRLLYTTQQDNGEIYGLVKNYKDENITTEDNTTLVCNGTNPTGYGDARGSGLDHVSFITDQNSSVTDRYMVSQFECGPGAMYMNQFDINDTTGEVSVVPNTMKYISQKEHNGGWVHCAGMTTPWSTHLGSEEYEPDARTNFGESYSNGYYASMVTNYFDGNASMANPYYWGWIPEVSITNGDANYTKHYSMGRAAWEMAYVMPDEKTVYLSDDGTNVGFYMYIADEAKDLSAGTLYAAKWIQLSEDGSQGGRAALRWVNLGHATDADVKAAVDADVNFTDIMAYTEPSSTNTCEGNATYVYPSTGAECLETKTSYSEAVIARLETRRVAAMKGATMEFRKEEGITFSPEHNVLFVAMSAIGSGMENNDSKDAGGNNDIRLAANGCGAVYGLNVAGLKVRDTNGADINSSYVVSDMNAIVVGRPTTYPTGHVYAGNKCDVDAIANPDNVAYFKGTNILAIGEDTGSHVNNVIWAYDVETKSLTRMLTTAKGSETTSPFWHAIDDNRSFMSAVVQHPDTDTAEDGFSSINVMGPVTK